MMLYLKFIFFVFIYLISDSKWALVESSGSEADPESGTDGAETPGSTDTELKPDVYPKHIKLFKADPNDANNTIELETTEYRTEKLGDEHLYVFNSGVNCNLLKIDDKEVWKYDSSKAGAKYPKGMRVNKRFKFVLVEFEGTVKVLIKHTDGNWTPFELDIKLFKDDPDGNKVEIKANDFYEDQYLGNLTYVFKPGVKCTLVKFGDKDVWKKGEQSLDEPKSVTYDSVLGEVTVRDADNSVHFGKDTVTGEWKHVVTIPRTKMAMSVKSAELAPKVGSPGSGLSSSMAKPETVLTGTPGSAEGPKEVDEASDKEDEETSTVLSGGADASQDNEDSEKEGPKEEASSKEENEENPEEKEASSDEDKETGAGSDDASSSYVAAESSESTDPGSTDGKSQAAESGSSTQEASESTDPGLKGGEDSSSSALTSPEDQDSTAQTAGGDDANGSGTLTGAGEPTDKGECEDGISQPSGGDGGSKTGEEDTGTSGGDGSSATPPPSSGGDSSTLGQDGSSATPLHSSGGDGSTVDPGQDGTATQTGSSGGDGASESSSSELDIKFFAKDPSDDKKTVELTSTSYDLKKLRGGNRIDYVFKENVQCTSIKIDDKELWKHGDHKCDDDPKSVSYRHGDTIVIHLGNGFVQYIKINNTWKVEFENNLKTSGDNTPDPSSQNQSQTKTSGGGGTGTDGSGGSTETGGGGTGSGGSSIHTGAGEGKGTSGEGVDGSRTGDGGGTGTGGDGSGSPSGGGGPTSGGGGGDGGSQPSSGSPTSGGTGITSGGNGSPFGGGGPTAGSTDQGTKTGAADSAGKEITNKSSSSNKNSSGCFGCFGCGSSKSS